MFIESKIKANCHLLHCNNSKLINAFDWGSNKSSNKHLHLGLFTCTKINSLVIHHQRITIANTVLCTPSLHTMQHKFSNKYICHAGR